MSCDTKIKFYKKLGPCVISVISYCANIWNKAYHIKHLIKKLIAQR